MEVIFQGANKSCRDAFRGDHSYFFEGKVCEQIPPPLSLGLIVRKIVKMSDTDQSSKRGFRIIHPQKTLLLADFEIRNL